MKKWPTYSSSIGNPGYGWRDSNDGRLILDIIKDGADTKSRKSSEEKMRDRKKRLLFCILGPILLNFRNLLKLRLKYDFSLVTFVIN
jgi:hypothetical protein